MPRDFFSIFHSDLYSNDEVVASIRDEFSRVEDSAHLLRLCVDLKEAVHNCAQQEAEWARARSKDWAEIDASSVSEVSGVYW